MRCRRWEEALGVTGFEAMVVAGRREWEGKIRITWTETESGEKAVTVNATGKHETVNIKTSSPQYSFSYSDSATIDYHFIF